MIILSSCKLLVPEQMFRAPVNYKYDKLDTAQGITYKMTSGDYLQMSIFSNNGYQLLDVLGQNASQTTNGINYLIKDNGYVNLPMIDSIYLKGKSVDEAQ